MQLTKKPKTKKLTKKLKTEEIKWLHNTTTPINDCWMRQYEKACFYCNNSTQIERCLTQCVNKTEFSSIGCALSKTSKTQIVSQYVRRKANGVEDQDLECRYFLINKYIVCLDSTISPLSILMFIYTRLSLCLNETVMLPFLCLAII